MVYLKCPVDNQYAPQLASDDDQLNADWMNSAIVNFPLTFYSWIDLPLFHEMLQGY